MTTTEHATVTAARADLVAAVIERTRLADAHLDLLTAGAATSAEKRASMTALSEAMTAVDQLTADLERAVRVARLDATCADVMVEALR